MAIIAIDDQGNITWRCPHMPGDSDKPCGAISDVHISHGQIQWTGLPQTKPEERMVSLPPCQACGAQTFLVVSYTEKELKAPNMWLEWNGYWEEKLQLLQAAYKGTEEGDHKTTLSAQINQLQAVKQAGGMHTPSHAMAQRHIELARQLVASGKTPPPSFVIISHSSNETPPSTTS